MNPFETLVEHCNESHPHMESPRGQIDIAKAKAEHAALLAVAEAASEYANERTGGDWRKWMQRYENDAMVDVELLHVCKALAQIQKGE